MAFKRWDGQEVEMRRIAANTDNEQIAIPRGWIILGLTFGAWLVAATFWSGVSGMFDLVSSLF